MSKATTPRPEQRPRTNRFAIVLPAGMHDKIRQHLFDDARNEQLGVILAGVSHTSTTTKFLGREFIPAEPADLDRQSYGGIAANPSFSLAEVHNLLTGFKDFESYVIYDQLKTEIMPLTIVRNASCALCSDSGVLGLGDLLPLPDYARPIGQFPPAPAVEQQTGNGDDQIACVTDASTRDVEDRVSNQ